MELTGLTRKQQVALTALMEAVAVSDGQITDGEQREIGLVAVALGEDTYQDLLDEADELFPDVETLKTFLGTVKHQDARDLIFGTVMEEVLSEPSVQHEKFALIEWLAKAWNINVEIKPEGE